MNISTQPYTVSKLSFFRRVIPVSYGNAGRLNTFEVYPHECERLGVVETTITLPEGITYSVGFVLDGVAYYLESESGFIPAEDIR